MLFYAVCITLALAGAGFAADTTADTSADSSAEEKLANNATLQAQLKDCVAKSNFTKEQFEHFCLTEKEPSEEPAESEFKAAITCLYNVTGVIKNGKVYPEKAKLLVPKEEEESSEKIAAETYTGDAKSDSQIAYKLQSAYMKKTDKDEFKRVCLYLVKEMYP